jgi:hypothetical protein
VSSDNPQEFLRRNSDDSSGLSPRTLRIGHQVFSAKRDKQRSLLAYEHVRARLNAESGVVVGYDTCAHSWQSTRTRGITNVEYLEDLKMLQGAIAMEIDDVDYAIAREMYNGAA